MQTLLNFIKDFKFSDWGITPNEIIIGIGIYILTYLFFIVVKEIIEIPEKINRTIKLIGSIFLWLMFVLWGLNLYLNQAYFQLLYLSISTLLAYHDKIVDTFTDYIVGIKKQSKKD